MGMRVCLVLAGLVLLAGGRARGDQPTKVAVWLVESRGTPLKADEVVGLTDYLASQVGQAGQIEVIPRDAVRKQIASATAGKKTGGFETAMRAALDAAGDLGADYSLRATITKVGRTCLTTLWVLPAGDPGAGRGIARKSGCEPDQLIEGIEAIGRQARATMTAAASGDGSRLAFTLLESRMSPLSADEMVGLTDYLAAKVAGSGAFVGLPHGVLPRDEWKTQFEKSRLTMNGSIAKVGKICLATVQIYDRQAKATRVTGSSKKACDPNELIVAIEDIAHQIQAKLRRR